jgi:hypothetical protein
MKIVRLAWIVLGAWTMSQSNPVFAQAAKGDAPPEKVPFCELAANAEKYDGHTVLTEAVVGESIHTNVLFDPLCYGGRRTKSGQILSAVPAFADITYLDSEPAQQYLKVLEQDGFVRVVIIGHVDSLQGMYGPQGLLFKISIRTLVSVYRIPQTEKEIYEFRKRGPPPIPTGK